MCIFFEVSRSGYYGYVSRMGNPSKDLPLAEKIKECQEKYGKLTVIVEYIYGLKDKGYTTIQKQYFV